MKEKNAKEGGEREGRVTRRRRKKEENTKEECREGEGRRSYEKGRMEKEGRVTRRRR